MSILSILPPRAPRRIIVLALASLVFLCMTYSQAKGEAPRPPGSPDGPAWVEVEGEAWLGELETPKEVRERAKMAALSKAVEEARGIFIRSHTLVSNGQLAEDLTYAAVRGKATTVRVISEGWSASEPRKWTTRISALVEPVFRQDGQGLSLRASLSKDMLREGEETKILYQAEDNCYVYIFSVADDGSVTLLLPNAFFRDNHLERKTAYEFPPPGSPLRLEAHRIPPRDGTYAEERVKLIVTREKEDLIPLGFREGTRQVYDARSTGMISDLVKRLGRLDPADWSETSVSYRIVRER